MENVEIKFRVLGMKYFLRRDLVADGIDMDRYFPKRRIRRSSASISAIIKVPVRVASFFFFFCRLVSTTLFVTCLF